jgi:hypothetical protein
VSVGFLLEKGKSRVGPRWSSRVACGWLALGICFGCGDEDVTTLHGEETVESAVEPAPAESRTFAVLSERESLDAVCRLLGVSSVARQPGAGEAACAQVVEGCRSNIEALLGPPGGEGPALGVPSGNLEPVLGCPLSFSVLDGCVAQVLERSVEAYGSSVSCDMPALPEVDTLELLASPECLSVVLLCPDLIGLAP